MRRWTLGVAIVAALAGGHVFALNKSAEAGKALAGFEQKAVILPSPILKIMALEFAGVAADLLFIEASAFHGEIIERKGEPPTRPDEWQWLASALKASTDLDPYFYDPYYFANAILPWQGQVAEANEILEKGVQTRIWDWTLPFYLGFNHFFFLHDHEAAATFLMESGRRPGAPSFISTLAARLAYQENKTENAIIFLEEIIEKTEDVQTRLVLETRLDALRKISQLEQAIADFRETTGRNPGDLLALVNQGIIQEIPWDPYGGSFYLAENGAVKTTSELR